MRHFSLTDFPRNTKNHLWKPSIRFLARGKNLTERTRSTKNMKRILILFILALLNQFCAKSQTSVPDSVAIRVTVLNYIEGWNSGDTVRMAIALHPKLAKRGVVMSPNGKIAELQRASYTDMMTWTASRAKLPEVKEDVKIVIYDIGKNIANAKCVSKEYIDHLHLMRINNEWKILNAIWELNLPK